MVAPNQDVSIRVLGPCSLAYTARINAPIAGRWQIVTHHGAAYALSYTLLPRWLPYLNVAVTPDLQGENFKEGKWAHFYWHLRYAFTQNPMRSLDPSGTLPNRLGARDLYAERLSWDASGFREARDL